MRDDLVAESPSERLAPAPAAHESDQEGGEALDREVFFLACDDGAQCASDGGVDLGIPLRRVVPFESIVLVLHLRCPLVLTRFEQEELLLQGTQKHAATLEGEDRLGEDRVAGDPRGEEDAADVTVGIPSERDGD